MDASSRTLLPATAEAGIAIPTVSRHAPIFRRCVEPEDSTILVARCLRPDRPLQGEHLFRPRYAPARRIADLPRTAARHAA
jgi:hypothetical protein